MATGTQGQAARAYVTRQTHYFVKKVVFGDDGVELSMGWAPAGAVVLPPEIRVKTAFDDSGTDLINVGTADDPDGFINDADVSSVGRKDDSTTFNASDDAVLTADTEIVCQYDGANSDATAGLAYVIVPYVVEQSEIDA